MSDDDETPAIEARGLMRALDRAALATGLGEARWPYASLVLTAADHDAAPVLLLSTLAEHTQNIAADPRASLLFDGTHGLESPLTGPRVTVTGRLSVTDEPRHRNRFLARHPDAALYADFGDFSFYRLDVERAHLVAGFGRIDWVDAADVLYQVDKDLPLLAQEAGIIAHMNDDHGDAVQLYANVLLDSPGDDWHLSGVDPEGCDLRRGGTVLRLPFDKPVRNSEEARAELVRLAKLARQ